MSKPEAKSSANSVGDQPARSKQMVGRRSGPRSWRAQAATRRSSAASDAPGGAENTTSPSPLRSATHVSTSAGMDRRRRARCALATFALPW